MKKLLLFFSVICCMASVQVHSQIIYGEYPLDSIVINFATNDTFPGYVYDTLPYTIWQRGNTSKIFPTTDSAPSVKGMMTDTVGYYPRNINDWFTVMIWDLSNNQIITFWHSYYTLVGHAGGVVEFSMDMGATWNNVKTTCNIDDSVNTMTGVRTENFYSNDPVLTTGDAAFTGTDYGAGYSRFQFFMGTTANSDTSCSFSTSTVMMLRFRFVSDTASDVYAGWLIDSISIRHDFYNDLVKNVTKKELDIFPNPAYDGQFHFPQLDNEQDYTIEIYNAMGMLLARMPYCRLVDLAGYPKGLYWYKVSNATRQYTGKLLTG